MTFGEGGADPLATLLVLAFWTCCGWLVYVYWGYGALLALAVRWRGKAPVATPSSDYAWPSVTILLTVHNEATNIGRRLQNLLEQDYPSGRFDILVASDGSTDGTDDIVHTFATAGPVRLVRTERVGKSKAQNTAMGEAKGDIVVLTDAETRFDRRCVRALVAPFADSSSGCTTAHLRFLERSGALATRQGGEVVDLGQY